MYTIVPKTLKEFIEDSSVKLPRFQRKATWNEKKRFELALSVFKNYPLGASILSREKQNKFLLDGRQRRDTLTMIYENPETLYEWGKKYFHISAAFDASMIREAFDNGVSEFIELDSDDAEEAEIDSTVEESDFEEGQESIQESLEENIDDDELSALRKAIVFGFLYKKAKMSGLTAVFDLKQYFVDSPIFWKSFYKADKKTIDGKKLRDKLHEYVRRYPRTFENKESFIEFMGDYGFKSDTARSQFVNHMNDTWDEQQLTVIKFYEIVDRIFQNRSIGFIETSDITATDSQKIFNLINTGGTKLTSSEILSAKPKWNSGLPPVSQQFRSSIVSLYNELTLDVADPDHPVKWDIPASLTFFLGTEDNSGLSLFFRFKDIAKRITTGFQLFSGFFFKGVKKEDIAAMADQFPWSEYEQKCNEVKTFFNVLATNRYLKVLRSWGKCLSDIVSDGPTLNFLFLAYRSFVELGGPTGFENTAKKIFDKNVFVLLDQTIYQYQCNQWKGSSDSLIAKNIEAFEQQKNRDSQGLITPVPAQLWKDVLAQIFDNNQVNGRLISQGDLNPMVYYYCVLKGIEGKGIDDPAEIDHILPQAKWLSSLVADKEAVQNSLFNLALLPKTINGPKSNNSLDSLRANAPDLAKEVSEYEEIPEADFSKYSSIANYSELKALREKLYSDAFGTKRTEILAA